MANHPHVHLDVTAALDAVPSIHVAVIETLSAEQAMATGNDLRSAALTAAELNGERRPAGGDADLVRGA